MKFSRLASFFGVSLIAVWVAAVVASGVGFNIFSRPTDFSNTGAFGDSFGPLGAIMAAFAAYAAFETLTEQRKEIARSKERESLEDARRELEDKRRIEGERNQAALDRRTMFESTFFNLLSYFRDIAKETDIGTGDDRKVSRDAFQKICSRLVHFNAVNQSLVMAWSGIINIYKNDLNHYFRFLYHIIKYVDQNDSVDKYFYVRLVRATLSEAELVLLFANCAVGEGKDKFKPLVEKYALLNNVSEHSRKNWKMEDYFTESAFQSNSQ